MYRQITQVQKMQLLKIAGFIITLFEQVNLCVSTCDDCVVTHLPDFDDLVVSDHQIRSLWAPSQTVCYTLCQMEPRCVSFQYNSVTGTCGVHASSFISPASTPGTPDRGNKLYLTCRADHHFGAACTDNFDCHTVLSECIDGICRCKLGLTFGNETWICGYHGCFEDRPARLLPYSEITSEVLTNELCVDHCLNAGYTLAGTEFGEECFCGNTTSDGYQEYSETRCDYQCRSDQNICGGLWAISIYSTGL